MDHIITGLRALAEPTRLRLLALCNGRELAVGELMDIVGQSQPRVSRHLKILTEAGLLDRFREGSRVYYRVNRSAGWAKVLDDLFSLMPADDRLAMTDQKRLEHIQASRAEAAENFFRNNAADWDRLRSLYVDEAEVETAVLKALALLPEHRHLDLGTGTGRLLALIAPQVSEAIGLDRSPEMLQYARATIADAGLTNASVRQGDLFQLPFNDDQFDRITIHQVLHYLDRPGPAIDEARRVLKPGGRLVIVDFAPHEEQVLAEQYHHHHLGFSSAEMARWLDHPSIISLPSMALAGDPLTVTLWAVDKKNNLAEFSDPSSLTKQPTSEDLS